MKIKRTTSNKNSWYAEWYDENLFGGKIPGSCLIPEGVIIDPQMLTDEAKSKLKQSHMGSGKIPEMVEESHSDQSSNHDDKSHKSLPPSKERFTFKLTPVAEIFKNNRVPRRLKFRTRSFLNKVHWVVYKATRIFFSSFFFYYFPFAIMATSFMLQVRTLI